MALEKLFLIHLTMLISIENRQFVRAWNSKLLGNFLESYFIPNMPDDLSVNKPRFTRRSMSKKAMHFQSPDDPRKHIWAINWPEQQNKLQLMAKKIKMSEVFSPDGIRVPVTILELLPETICQFLPFGYAEVCYGGLISEHAWLKRPHIGKILNISGNYRYIVSCKFQPPQNFVLGQTLDTSSLLNNTHITLTGTGKGKGFGGTIARHGFKRGPKSHGSRHHRKPGSIGAGTDPGRVFPGKKMPGRYGNKRVTIRDLKIIAINPIKNLLMVKGSVPGNPKAIVKITSQ